jgi:exodeoxyribonuclease VII large subunit
VAEKEGLQKRLADTASRLLLLFQNRLTQARQHLHFLTRGLRDPRKGLADIWLKLDELQNRLGLRLQAGLKERRQHLSFALRTLLLYSPLHLITTLRRNLVYSRQSQAKAMRRLLKDWHAEFSVWGEKLKNLNPLSVLKRGYSLTRKWPEKEVLKTAREVQPGQQVQVLLGEGELHCRVEKVILDRS